jgi:hypothetical protein
VPAEDEEQRCVPPPAVNTVEASRDSEILRSRRIELSMIAKCRRGIWRILASCRLSPYKEKKARRHL